MAEKRRASRVVGRVQLELMEIIRRELRDPRVQDVVITRVDMPDDLQLARVYFRNAIDNDPVAVKTTQKGLEAAKGKLRSALAKAVKMKYAPDLTFYFDSGQDASKSIEGILDEIAQEPKRPADEE